MPFIGNQPALSYTSFAKQDFSTSATTTYTLDNPVANANELALFINFVRQEPTTAYSASGTTLTLTSATSSSDDMYCVYLGKAVQTVNPPNASVGTAQLADSSVTSAKLGTGATNTPAFRATMNADQTVATGTFTKINYDTVDYDTNSAYSDSNKRFTVPTGFDGKYVFFASTNFHLDDIRNLSVLFYKNGSAYNFNRVQVESASANSFTSLVTSISINLSAGDYIEVFTKHENGNDRGLNKLYAEFTGHKLIGV